MKNHRLALLLVLSGVALVGGYFLQQSHDEAVTASLPVPEAEQRIYDNACRLRDGIEVQTGSDREVAEPVYQQTLKMLREIKQQYPQVKRSD